MIAYLKKNYSGCRIKFMFRLFFALIGQFSPVYNYIHGRLSESFSGSQAELEQHLDSQAAFGNPKHVFSEEGHWKDFYK
jgi:hypothetical protein